MRKKLSLPAAPVRYTTALLASPWMFITSVIGFTSTCFSLPQHLFAALSFALAAFCVSGIGLAKINNAGKQTRE